MTETEGKIMKKILIATTALVATAGVAAAEVNLSGLARFGMEWNEGAGAAADTTGNSTRVRWQLDAATTTDSGVGLNVRQRIQSETNATNATNGGRFGLTYGPIAINMGNINGAMDSTPNLYMPTASAGVGLDGNGFESLVVGPNIGYSSGAAGSNEGVEVIYSENGLRVHVSDNNAVTAYGASFALGDITVGAAYEDVDAGGALTLVTAGMSLAGVNVAIAHGITETAAGIKTDETAIKAAYDVAPGMNVYGFVKSETAGNASGVGMSYGLGGGASFEAGYTSSAAGLGTASAGIFFTF
jgi:outer membrane protein OmpU